MMSETQSLNLVHSSPNKRREEERKEGLMAVIWSEIPEELLYLFVERLVWVDDLIRFSCVCKLWRSVAISEKKKNKAYSPILMLANADNDTLPTNGEGVRSFLIPVGGRSFNLVLPKAQGRRCWGSPYGWVVTVGLDLDIALLNPLTGEEFHLPPQPILQEKSIFSKMFSFTPRHDPPTTISFLIRKLVLGWHHSSQSWLVMAIFGAGEEVGFMFTGNGNEVWTCLESTIDAEDVILFQDQIYVIAFGGELKVYDLKEGTPPNAIHVAWPPADYPIDTFYLVEIGGNLHFVARDFDPIEKEDRHRHVTIGFSVWRFDFSDTMWYKLDDLGEYALFLGNNTSYAISTSTYPDFSTNCVYFTDDRYKIYNDGFCDMGVYDYKEKTVKPFDIPDMGAAFSKFSRPTFFMPTL